ncbi:MAG: hypothetical protein ABS81_14620 [Pseudonocardia sp. SCN 72-86]|nr:MAG: hypothetical protein ABS81_14620 [Pseudonocardia sp. SCN 72-86]
MTRRTIREHVAAAAPGLDEGAVHVAMSGPVRPLDGRKEHAGLTVRVSIPEHGVLVLSADDLLYEDGSEVTGPAVDPWALMYTSKRPEPTRAEPIETTRAEPATAEPIEAPPEVVDEPDAQDHEPVRPEAAGLH